MKLYPSQHVTQMDIYKILFYSVVAIITLGIILLPIYIYRQRIKSMFFKKPDMEVVVPNVEQPILNRGNIPPAYLAFVGLKSGLLKKSDFLDDEDLEDVALIPPNHTDGGHLCECDKCGRKIE